MSKENKIFKSVSPRIKTRENLLSFYNEIFFNSKWSLDYLNSFFVKKNDGVCFIVKKENEIAGFIIGKKHRIYNETMIICALCVKPKFRRYGLGSYLIDFFLKESFDNKLLQKVIVHFRDSNDLKAFYEKNGFKNHSVEGEYKNGEIKHQMIAKNRNSCRLLKNKQTRV